MVTDIEQIEKYLAGELSSDELQAFEQRLQTDTSFAETFQLYKAVQEEMQEGEDENELRKNLSGLGNKYFSQKEEAKIISLKSNKKWWWYAAAAACVAAILLIVKPWQEKHMTNEQVLAQYAQPEELTATLRGTSEDSLLINAAKIYNKKEYSMALPLLDSAIKLKPGNAAFELSLAICYVQTGNYTNAETKLNELAQGQSTYKYAAMEWKGYNFLKQGKRNECISTLKEIPAEAENYSKVQNIIKLLSK